MEQAFNTNNSENAQQFHEPRGEVMMTVIRFFSLIILIGLVGCDTHYEYVWEEGAHQVQAPKQVQTPKVEQASPAPQPAATLVASDSFKNVPAEPLADPVPAKSQRVVPDPESLSFGRYLTLDSNLYISKAGELMGDLTIENNNFVSVNRIMVRCVEFNMNNILIREASIILGKTLQVGESGYWDQINFGYVHNDFETVQCTIANAKLS